MVENIGYISVCAVIAEGYLERDVQIQYDTYDGTARGMYMHRHIWDRQVWFSESNCFISDNEDYEGNSGEIVFYSDSIMGDTQCVNISINDDPTLEDSEFFTFVLLSNDQNIELCNESAHIYIENDDGTFLY